MPLKLARRNWGAGGEIGVEGLIFGPITDFRGENDIRGMTFDKFPDEGFLRERCGVRVLAVWEENGDERREGFPNASDFRGDLDREFGGGHGAGFRNG